MILFWLCITAFVIVCILICFLVLIQSDKGGGISGAIGGGLGGANSLLGTQDTANILTRGTVIFGIAFFCLCIIMSFMMTKQTYSAQKSMLQKRAEKQQSYSPSSVLNQQSGIPRPAPAGAGMPAGQPAPAPRPGAAPGIPGVPVGQQHQ